jgi:transcription-repair coupling factor (superfamily II helicase)
MKVKEVVSLFENDPAVNLLLAKIGEPRTNIKLKGLVGSSDALNLLVTSEKIEQPMLVIMHDKEDADLLMNDLIHLEESRVPSFFPTSYKKPYQPESIDNANILHRSETLTRALNEETKIIVTYPEALVEKVLNKRSLLQNVFKANVGELVDIPFLSELFSTYGFESTDFVYEPGQFAVRGGIIDVFSFSSEFPLRLELFGNEIESIRTFDPETQLSKNSLQWASIMPNTHTQLLKEERISLLEYLPENTLIWIKDLRETQDIITKAFEKAADSFHTVISISNNTQVVQSPPLLYETSASFTSLLEKRKVIEFGKRAFLSPSFEIDFENQPQPSFNKNFEFLADSLGALQHDGFDIFIFSDSEKQLERLTTIFEEIDPSLSFSGITGSLNAGFISPASKIACLTDHQIFDRIHRTNEKPKFNKKKALTLRELKSLQTGDYVVHIDHGVARFAGLDKVMRNGNQQEVIRLVYRDDDLLYVSVHALHKISKYAGKEGGPPATSKLGSKDWETKKNRVKSKVKDIAKELITLYAKRKTAPGFAFPKDTFLQAELESSFMYQETPDQHSATVDIKTDMERVHPMDRLICGDVGFGKTEVAIRAAFKAVNANKQVAVLVPTTILALQHYQTFSERLRDFPITVDFVNRFKTAKEITAIKKKLRDGHIDILIGTHRIVNKDMIFKDLGLMIIDEEQKFGVKIKEQLKELRVNVDAMTLTATPIPRTLHFSLMGARDLSIIATPPPNRVPVTTEVCEFSEEVIRDAVHHELRRNGQVFFVHNRIGDIESLANLIYRLVPDARIAIAHGQMAGPKLEKVMVSFINGAYDVLISTNIIESGLDIPNANTIIINRAHMFGLSDLHQMRGRVGRSNTKAYCYLLTPAHSTVSSDARKRLIALEEFSELGDGFKVAMRDLDIRGAGDLLGSEQSGFVNDLGFDMYHKILDDAVLELKENEFKELFQDDLVHEKVSDSFVSDCVLETDLEILIPQEYITNTSERLRLYNDLDNVETDEALLTLQNSTKDRFGALPEPVNELIKSVRLRWLGRDFGLDKIVLKNSAMKLHILEGKKDAYFLSPAFKSLIQFAQNHPRRCKIKEQNQKLIFSIDHIHSLDDSFPIFASFHRI